MSATMTMTMTELIESAQTSESAVAAYIAAADVPDEINLHALVFDAMTPKVARAVAAGLDQALEQAALEGDLSPGWTKLREVIREVFNT
jgi:hypothetical protein